MKLNFFANFQILETLQCQGLVVHKNLKKEKSLHPSGTSLIV
jgi:hypothetical protein